MWRLITRLATTTLTAMLAFAALSDLQAGAATVQSYGYSTTGTIDGPSGADPITFVGVNSQSFTAPGTFSLGQFDAANVLPASATLTYNNTPFTIMLNVVSGSVTSTYELEGTLNGSISGSGVSSMVATVSSITGMPSMVDGTPTTPPFPASDLLVNPQAITAPNVATGPGITNLYAQANTGLVLLAPVPAPEPTTLAIVGVGLAIYGARRFRRPRAAA